MILFSSQTSEDSKNPGKEFSKFLTSAHSKLLKISLAQMLGPQKSFPSFHSKLLTRTPKKQFTV
jgi:hypothetical protein